MGIRGKVGLRRFGWNALDADRPSGDGGTDQRVGSSRGIRLDFEVVRGVTGRKNIKAVIISFDFCAESGHDFKRRVDIRGRNRWRGQLDLYWTLGERCGQEQSSHELRRTRWVDRDAPGRETALPVDDERKPTVGSPCRDSDRVEG